MKANVKDIAIAEHNLCTQNELGVKIENQATMLCSVLDKLTESLDENIYQGADDLQLFGIIQARHIAQNVLSLSRQSSTI